MFQKMKNKHNHNQNVICNSDIQFVKVIINSKSDLENGLSIEFKLNETVEYKTHTLKEGLYTLNLSRFYRSVIYGGDVLDMDYYKTYSDRLNDVKRIRDNLHSKLSYRETILNHILRKEKERIEEKKELDKVRLLEKELGIS